MTPSLAANFLNCRGRCNPILHSKHSIASVIIKMARNLRRSRRAGAATATSAAKSAKSTSAYSVDDIVEVGYRSCSYDYDSSSCDVSVEMPMRSTIPEKSIDR